MAQKSLSNMGVGMAPEHQATEGAPTMCWPWGYMRTHDRGLHRQTTQLTERCHGS